MSVTEHPAHLRARARSLRRLATDLERTPAMSLDADAGPSTWQIPRGEACVALLHAHQLRVHHAAEELRWLAHSLDVRADDLERAARGIGGWAS